MALTEEEDGSRPYRFRRGQNGTYGREGGIRYPADGPDVAPGVQNGVSPVE